MQLSRQTKYRLAEISLLIVAAVAAAFLIINLISSQRQIAVLFLAGVAFTAALLAFFRLMLDPERVRASQSNAMLSLASETLGAMSENNLSPESAQKICDLMLPSTSAVAVAITDKEKILGYAGRDKELNATGSTIRTLATHAAIADGQMRILRTQEEIGFPTYSSIHAAIIAPLSVGNETIGTLKFYYPSARRLTETQESIAQGFAELLSTQASARALEEQRKLATSMELKVLQSQINPHFLFNTINTIASFIRTNPDHARELLREFATFYRRTLEDATDLITLERELDQTQRYLGFEIARFGEDRLQFSCMVEPGLEECLVPAFMVQPLVENAVRHAMPLEGTLHIICSAHSADSDLTIVVEDDGVGISQQVQESLLHSETSEGLGIALRNIQERVRVYYGEQSYLRVNSQEGRGTSVTLFLKNGRNLSGIGIIS